jgi:hypothetical protein
LAIIALVSECTALLKTLGVSAVSPAIAATKDPSSCDSVIAASAFVPGDVILTGSFVKAIAVAAGDEIGCEFDHVLGRVDVSFT